MLDYIFNKLKNTENDIGRINRTLLVQSDLNILYSVVISASLVKMVVLKKHMKKQDKEIEGLRQEIEALKKEKGE